MFRFIRAIEFRTGCSNLNLVDMIMYLKVVAVRKVSALFVCLFFISFSNPTIQKGSCKKKKKNLKQLASVTVEISSSHKQDFLFSHFSDLYVHTLLFWFMAKYSSDECSF